MKLADNLKIIRKEHNLSQEQFAEQLGVSRQAVSKWESGQSYPEMDKVLLICKLFNYKIDELMNENIKEIDDTKQSKNSINKFIEDFFTYITKTVDMICSMNFKQKCKCIFEQLLVGTILLCLFLIIGAVFSTILSKIIGGLPYSIYESIIRILEALYIILASFIGITILLHIFKIRYLDYYEIIKEKKTDSNTIEIQEVNESQKKIEKIIIRDPEHSQSKFLTGLLKFTVFFLKIITVFIAIAFALSFIILIVSLVLSFLFLKTGIVFVGTLLGIIGALILNFVILSVLYNFISSKRIHKTKIALSILIALILIGISIGIIIIGITKFDIVTDERDITDTYNIEMSDDLSFWNFYDVAYIESDIDNVKIEVSYSKDNKQVLLNENGTIIIYPYEDDTKIMDNIREFINNLNNKKVIIYPSPKICVYASKDNIKKIEHNTITNWERDNEVEYDILDQDLLMQE